ncbi:hypothetical protein AOLI_G00148220 [Acnodon oligacanthus]
MTSCSVRYKSASRAPSGREQREPQSLRRAAAFALRAAARSVSTLRTLSVLFSPSPRLVMAHWAAFGLLLALLVITAESRPATQTQHETLRELLGDELADLVISGDTERALAARARLLRDLRVDTRAKGRLLRTQDGQDRHPQWHGLPARTLPLRKQPLMSD